MQGHPNASDFGPLSDDERRELERCWSDGGLRAHAERLLAFVTQQRDEILRLTGGQRDAAALLDATRRLIIAVGTVHPKSEMQDQITEIQRELWYRGEKGDHDHARIKHEWTSRHARSWRRWRIKEYLFVADHCAGEIVRALTM